MDTRRAKQISAAPRYSCGVSAFARALALVAVVMSGVSAANAASTASGSAYGISVEAALNGPLPGTNESVSVGPLPGGVSGNAPADYSASGTTVSATASLGALGTLASAGILNADASSNLSANQSSANASAADVGVHVAPAAAPAVMDSTADLVSSNAQASCVAGAVVLTGATQLVNAQLSLLGLAATSLEANPAPNTMVPIVGVAGLSVVLNEQIVAGDQITVNAIHISFLNLSAAPNTLNGDIIVAQSVTSLSGCSHPNSVIGGADLSMVKTASSASVMVGDAFSYTLRVDNAGPETATSTMVTDRLPDGARWISASATQGSCSAAGQAVTCDLGAIAVGSSVTITIAVRAMAPGRLLNTASVASAVLDGNLANNTGTASIVVLSAACGMPVRTFTPESGFWWNPAEPGSGFNIEIQDNFLALTAYTYTAAGSVTWFTAQGLMQGDARFAGNLDAFSGGQCMGCNYTAPTASLRAGGPITIDFTTETRGTMTAGGRTIPIERFDFFLTRTPGDVKTEMMLGEWQLVADLNTCHNPNADDGDHQYYGDVLVIDTVDRGPNPDKFLGCRPSNRSAGSHCDTASRGLHEAAGFYSSSNAAHVLAVKDMPATATAGAVYFAYYVRTGTYQFDGVAEVCAPNLCGRAGATFYPLRGFRTVSHSFVSTGAGPSSVSSKHGAAGPRGLYEVMLGTHDALPPGLTAAEVKASYGIDVEALAPQTNALIDALGGR